jgi:hypothetical protein
MGIDYHSQMTEQVQYLGFTEKNKTGNLRVV